MGTVLHGGTAFLHRRLAEINSLLLEQQAPRNLAVFGVLDKIDVPMHIGQCEAVE
jgi:hypothetical protein